MSRIAIVGGGPAGLMAAEALSAAGCKLDIELFDAMPSLGRKFLMAGKGGLNITHSEAPADFLVRYGERQSELATWLEKFGPDAVRAWVHGLGIETFVGSSGRIFPAEMKAAPLLRAWLHRLRQQGVHFHVRHRWLGWSEAGALRFATPAGPVERTCSALILALGGGSWAKLGSDGAWLPLLAAQGVDLAPLKPANCGFEVAWTPYFSQSFAGQPVKSVVARVGHLRQPGEFNITAQGLEGGLIYALAAPLRDALDANGQACLQLDLAPGWTVERLAAELARPRGRDSLASHWRRRIGIAGVKAGLLRECCPPEVLQSASALAAMIKALPLPILAPRPIDEAISTAGGVRFAALDEGLMLHCRPAVFCAGEMIDWEAPTGGYLLTACLASGQVAAAGVLDWLGLKPENRRP